jgi:perosamine synthetase
MQVIRIRNSSKLNIPVFSPWIDDEDISSVTDCLRNGWISGTSPIVSNFESGIKELSQKEYVTAVANGSVALDLAFASLNLQTGDEVILPNLTIISCLAAVIRAGATPVLVDVNPIDWNMSFSAVREAFTERTKAVLAVHTYGLPAPIAELRDYCSERGALLIEDAAEAHGLIISGNPSGSFGDISTYSFYANKHVTSGEGGAVCTNSPIISERVNQLRNLAFGKVNRFEHEELGWNYRISGLAAALGISQLKKLDKIIAEKKIQGAYYSQLLGEMALSVSLPAKTANGGDNNYWVYGIVVESNSMRHKIMTELIKAGVETRPFFHPLSEQPVTKSLTVKMSGSLDTSLRLGQCGFYLPTGAHVTPAKQEYVVESIAQIFKH